MRLFPRTGSYLIDSMLLVLRALLFTLGVCLVVGVSALLIRATLVVTDPYAPRHVSSVLALFVFVVYLGVPTYLLATRTDLGDGGGDGPLSGDEGAAPTERSGTPGAVDEPRAPDEAAAGEAANGAEVADAREGEAGDGGGASEETRAA